MDANLQEILDNLDEKVPRSRLGPYRDLILELRRRHRTYREILQILAGHCQIQVSISTLYDFLHAQRRIEVKLKKLQAKEQNSPDPNNKPQPPARINEGIPDTNDVQQRIAALKKRTSPTQTNVPRFSYDPNQPLHLLPNMKKSGSEE
jgi:IS30 family transposase